jgi:hypothetical protein
MKFALLVLAMAFCIPTVAQDSTVAPVASAFNRVLLGLSISPDYCYRTLRTSTEGAGAGEIAQRDDHEQPKFGYSAGLNVQYNFSPHVGLGVGLHYAERGYVSDQDLTWIAIDPNDPAIPTNLMYRYKLTFIDIPVRFIFQTGGERLRFIGSVGVAGNILLRAKAEQEFEYADGHVDQKHVDARSTYRSVNLSAIGSVGAAYHLTDRSFLQLEPAILYNLFPVTDASVRTYLWSGGLNITFNCALR